MFVIFRFSQLPQPVIKTDRIAIKIPEDEYQAGLFACKHNFNGRMLWPKGSTPLKMIDLKSKLSPIWKSLGTWGIMQAFTTGLKTISSDNGIEYKIMILTSFVKNMGLSTNLQRLTLHNKMV